MKREPLPKRKCRMTNIERVLKASGWMANVAGQITGVDLNFPSRRSSVDVSISELYLMLPQLRKAVSEYNAAIILLSEEKKDDPR